MLVTKKSIIKHIKDSRMGYWEEMTSFLRNLFHATFKTNKYCIDGLPNRN